MKPIPARVYHVPFHLDQAALATAKVLDAQGNETALLWSNRALPAGPVTVDWDGRDKSGQNPAPGAYQVVLSTARFGLKALGSFGGQGATPGRFLNPQGLCAFSQGARLTVAVADTGNNRVQLLTDTGAFLQSAGSFGADQSSLSQPTDVDWDGQILTVCDSQNRRLVLFDDRGSYLSQVVKLTGLQITSDNVQPVLDFETPVCIRHDAGAFWVSDSGHGILFHVTNTGGILDEIGEKFPLNNEGPFLAVAGNFWVKTAGDQVQVMDSNGNVQDQIKPDPPFKEAAGFAASAQGFNLVIDSGNGLIYLLDNNGRVFQVWTPDGTSKPGALSLWEDQLFTVDSDQNEVFHYQINRENGPELRGAVQTQNFPAKDMN